MPAVWILRLGACTARQPDGTGAWHARAGAACARTHQEDDMANYSSERDRQGNDPRQRADDRGSGGGRDHDVRPDEWGAEWGEDWRGQDEVGAGGPWYEQQAPAG